MRYFACFAIAATTALAQENPFSADIKSLYAITTGNITKSAEKVSDELYSFKPSPDVRTFGELIGHVADAQYLFCSAAKAEKNPSPGIEKGKKTKAELVPALKEAFAYCQAVYDGLTDKAGMEKVKFFRGERTRASVLDFNSMHNYEHYGNLVTYMRINKIVPPSSESR